MSRKRNVIALLERARALCEPRTWYQLSKQTGIAETTISRCRRRGGTLMTKRLKLATFLRMDAPTVMAYMAEDRARDAETKEFWRHKLPRLLPSVAIASAGLWALGGALTDGAQSATTQLIDTTRYTLCEVRRRLEKRARPAPAFGC